jgi:hypothetical protein
MNKIETTVLKYANQLAIEAKYKGLVRPVKIEDWKRPTSEIEIGGYTLVKLGIITSAEAAVIHTLRRKVNFAVNAQRLEILQVLAAIQIKLDVDGEKELLEVLSTPALITAKTQELGIDPQEILDWWQNIEVASNAVDVESVKASVRHHMVTFFMAMRCNPEWDYQDTEQLSDKDMEDVLDFLYAEEDDIPQNQEPENDIKKA